jgi:hypothetical protein
MTRSKFDCHLHMQLRGERALNNKFRGSKNVSIQARPGPKYNVFRDPVEKCSIKASAEYTEEKIHYG